LHTPKALAALFKFVNNCNLENMNSNLAAQILEDLKLINNIFDVWTFEEKQEQFPNEIIELAEQRFKAKMDKNWSLADELRIKLTESGYQVKDSKDYYVLLKI
jgi:cysteinyl-tRNA synthetase